MVLVPVRVEAIPLPNGGTPVASKTEIKPADLTFRYQGVAGKLIHKTDSVSALTFWSESQPQYLLERVARDDRQGPWLWFGKGW